MNQLSNDPKMLPFIFIISDGCWGIPLHTLNTVYPSKIGFTLQQSNEAIGKPLIL